MAQPDTPSPAPAQLFALRLRHTAPDADAAHGLLHGEIEHVLSGARCSFGDAAELVAWLQAQLRRTVAPGPPPLWMPDQPAGAAPRDATM